MKKKYSTYMMKQLEKLLAIDSTSGFCYEIQEYLDKEFRSMGYAPKSFNRGGLLVDLGGRGPGIVVTAHADDIGLMVRRIKPNGHLSVVMLGGLFATQSERANVRVHTRDGRVYTGFVQNENPSAHVKPQNKRNETPDYDTNTEIVLDEHVSTEEEVKALGIRCGDIVALDPQLVITPSGFVKSRFLDDKSCVAALLAYAKMLKEEKKTPARHVYAHISVTEEVSMGANYGMPEDMEEMLALDIGCAGPQQYTTEDCVAICAKDARWPYDYGMISRLIEAAEKNKIKYAVDIFHPSYGSDALGALGAGYDVRAVVIGPGVLATHGYERTTIAAMEHTHDLIDAYIG
ncbi:MAG: M42 family metallopeptidase [Clostridia bacterium]|nr:M42 family metallopeptidase [Clostridia bacterium]